MKGKIKVKIKYLILILIFIFVIFPNLLYFVARTMFINEKGFLGGELVLKPYSYGIFELYTKLPKISFFDGDAYFYMGRLKYDYNVSVATNAMDGVIGNYNLDLGSYDEAVKLHEKGLSKSNGIDYSLNSTALFNLYLERGEREKEEKIIEDSLKKESWKENSAGKVLKIQLAIIDGDNEEALNLYREIEQIARNKGLEDFLLKSEDYYPGERLNLGDKFYLINEKNFIFELENTMNITRIYSDMHYEGQTYKNFYLNGTNTIKGKITIDGKPLKYRPVIIGISSFNGFIYRDNWLQSYGEIIYTNKEGNYETKNVPDMENVNIVPLLTKEQALDNTIEYTVVKDVKNSKIFLDKFNGYSAMFETRENKIKIPLLNGSFSTMENFKDKKIGEITISLNSFLGRYKKDTIDFIEVMAIKELNGEEIVMNSNKIKTKITSKEKLLNEGEKLIEKGEIDAGIKWIEEKIKEEGYKREYIYPLIYITSFYENGLDEEGKEKIRKEANKKIEIAKKSEKILLDELYKINKNKEEIVYYKNIYEKFYNYYGVD